MKQDLLQSTDTYVIIIMVLTEGSEACFSVEAPVLSVIKRNVIIFYGAYGTVTHTGMRTRLADTFKSRLSNFLPD